ncbi:hypothetical protein G7Y89_g7182 [Cudoniella acicularis]|uniref:NACHT domain-containing protein n=1 Tax=Cudoniella acicularis TaxID=354080 RepID=A0A8H4RMJ7_9HELO|nr:hypothetical protein G7Y89_g7182 [Cudoniella acicularis]
MDPITAFSVAGTVIQFVDFGSELLSGAHEIYKSTAGSLTVNEELELVTADFRAVVLRLEHLAPHSEDARTPENHQFQQGMVKICDEAKVLATDVINRLEEFKLKANVKGHKLIWASLFQAVKIAWSKDELDSVVKRLESLKSALQNRVLLALSEKMELHSIQMSERFNSLDRQTQQIISALVNGQNITRNQGSDEAVRTTAALSQILCRFRVENYEEHRKTRAMIVGIDKGNIIPNIELLDVPPDEEIQLRKQVGTRVLQSLHFSTMDYRIEQIAEAHRSTFNWIFNEEASNQHHWSNFSEWLQTGEGVYWMKGKAGSGKSTLLKYIYEDPRTFQLLSAWAGTTPLYLSSFFFWAAGSPEQKSFTGLLRGLLFEILNQQPELIPIALPQSWARTYSHIVGDKAGILNGALSLRMLKEAFTLLMTQHIVQFKLCLFVDGLDEFDGDHEEMAEFFKTSTSPFLKVCLSSRPWVVFEDCFRDSPGLQLQDLTRPDIEQYVGDVLIRHTAFQRLSTKEPDSTSTIVEEITERAEGVFLWVFLVVKSLLNGIRNQDAMSDLQRRLLELPRELEPLYNHFVGCIEPIYHPWASMAFQVVRASQESDLKPKSPCSILGLYLAINGDLDLKTVKHWTRSHILSECRRASVQLTARCMGLLETGKSPDGFMFSGPRVNYIHRTAKDYLAKPEVWQTFIRHTEGTFNPDVAIAKSCVLQLGIISSQPAHPQHWKWSRDIAINAVFHTSSAERTSNKVPQGTLDDLDQLMCTIRSTSESEFSATNWTICLTTIDDKTCYQTSPFLKLAICFGLTEYIRCKRNEIETLIQGPLQGTDSNLLCYAIPTGRSRFETVQPSMVDVLLAAGANPNSPGHHGESAWRAALRYAHGLGDSQMRNNTKVILKAFQILTLMLGSGADPREAIKVADSCCLINASERTFTVEDFLIEMRKSQIWVGSLEPPELTALSVAIKSAFEYKLSNVISGEEPGPSTILLATAEEAVAKEGLEDELEAVEAQTEGVMLIVDGDVNVWDSGVAVFDWDEDTVSV